MEEIGKILVTNPHFWYNNELNKKIYIHTFKHTFEKHTTL